MFKSNREFRDEDGLDDDVIINLNDICSDVAPNLNDLEIGIKLSQKDDTIEVDEDIFHVKVMKEHARDYKKFERLIEGNQLRMAEHATSEFRALLNRMSELCLTDYQCTLHPETQCAKSDRDMGN